MLKPLAGRWGTRTGRRRGVMAATLLASLLYVIVRPAYADGAVGGSAGSFLDFEIGGRPSGMGGAQVGSAAGITAQYWNPAALASLEQQQIGAMHATWLEDLNYEWIGYAKPISPKWGVGSVSIAYFHLPSLDGVDDFGNPTGSFNVSDMAFTVGLARPLGRGVSVGANLKAIRQNLADVSAMGPAMDFGASVKYGERRSAAWFRTWALVFPSTDPRPIRFRARFDSARAARWRTGACFSHRISTCRATTTTTSG